MYADYPFYQSKYHGTVSEAEYTRLAVRAAAYVDRMTFGRAKTATKDDMEAVKMAECAIVDELSAQEQGGIVTSETNDGISRSYATGSVVKSSTQRIYAAAEVFLCNTNLCFVGV
jgi:hypothetical protein